MRRKGIQKHFLRYGHRLWIDSKTIRSLELSQSIFYIDRPKSNGLVTDRSLSSRAEINFSDQSRFQVEFSRNYTYLIDEFDPLRVDIEGFIKTKIKEQDVGTFQPISGAVDGDSDDDEDWVDSEGSQFSDGSDDRNGLRRGRKRQRRPGAQ